MATRTPASSSRCSLCRTAARIPNQTPRAVTGDGSPLPPPRGPRRKRSPRPPSPCPACRCRHPRPCSSGRRDGRCSGRARGTALGLFGPRIADDHRLAATVRQVRHCRLEGHSFGEPQHVRDRVGLGGIGHMRQPPSAGPSVVSCKATIALSPLPRSKKKTTCSWSSNAGEENTSIAVSKRMVRARTRHFGAGTDCRQLCPWRDWTLIWEWLTNLQLQSSADDNYNTVRVQRSNSSLSAATQ